MSRPRSWKRPFYQAFDENGGGCGHQHSTKRKALNCATNRGLYGVYLVVIDRDPDDSKNRQAFRAAVA